MQSKTQVAPGQTEFFDWGSEQNTVANMALQCLTNNGLTSYQPQCSHPFIGGEQLYDVCNANSSALFLLTFNSLLAVHPKINDPCGRVTPIQEPRATYDFVVVGGGAGGAVVAGRLSENQDWSVLLVEAGPDEPAGTQVPSNLQVYLNSELDWKYHTTNESHACLSTGGSCSWPRGKNLGGCTTHHGMAYHRGHAKDYERWVKKGSVGWSYDDVLPFFKKSEDNKEIGRVSAKYHGTGGPMTVERFPWHPKFANTILEAADQQGFGTTEDLVGEKITGFNIVQTISKDGVRQSSVSSFIRPVRHRSNLDVAVNALAQKVQIVGKRATGVELEMNGKKYTVKAKREVILAGGAINTPQLLLLSGVGPAKDLLRHGIPVKKILPGVGENLHNHQSYGIDFTLAQPAKEELNIDNSDLYLYNQTGPLSSTGLAQVTALLSSKYTTPDDPDIQIFFAGYQAACTSKTGIADLSVYDNKMTVRFTAVNVQPTSRGRLTLKNKDPSQPPVIWSNDLGEPRDRKIIIEGIHVLLSLANATAMRNVGLTMVPNIVQKCSHYPKYSDDYWGCAIQWDTRPENHQAGTCKMGPSSDRMAVVDPRLQVHGIKGLRLADASIMPQVISGNPVAVINMIGERAADFIKQDWGLEGKKS